MPGLISFTKMHGLGNDFVVIDATSQSITLSPSDIIYISDKCLNVQTKKLSNKNVSSWSRPISFHHGLFEQHIK